MKLVERRDILPAIYSLVDFPDEYGGAAHRFRRHRRQADARLLYGYSQHGKPWQLWTLRDLWRWLRGKERKRLNDPLA